MAGLSADHMGRYLKEMLERLSSQTFSNGLTQIEVALNSPFGEVSTAYMGCLSSLGVTWGDALRKIGYTLEQWLKLTSDVMSQYRPLLSLLPEPTTIRILDLGDRPRKNLSHTSKRLRARDVNSSPVRDGNYYITPACPSVSPDRVSGGLGGSPELAIRPLLQDASDTPPTTKRAFSFVRSGPPSPLKRPYNRLRGRRKESNNNINGPRITSFFSLTDRQGSPAPFSSSEDDVFSWGESDSTLNSPSATPAPMDSPLLARECWPIGVDAACPPSPGSTSTAEASATGAALGQDASRRES